VENKLLLLILELEGFMCYESTNKLKTNLKVKGKYYNFNPKLCEFILFVKRKIEIVIWADKEKKYVTSLAKEMF